MSEPTEPTVIQQTGGPSPRARMILVLTGGVALPAGLVVLTMGSDLPLGLGLTVLGVSDLSLALLFPKLLKAKQPAGD